LVGQEHKEVDRLPRQFADRKAAGDAGVLARCSTWFLAGAARLRVSGRSCGESESVPGDRGGEGSLLFSGGGVVPDETAENLAGVFERDPYQRLDNLGDGELIAQKLDLGVADGGVVRRDGLRERDGQRLLGL
jgi:hypothetical protein